MAPALPAVKRPSPTNVRPRAAPSSPSHVALQAIKKPPEWAKWRALIYRGRHTEAEKALRLHLAGSPNDARAWSLLADCLRKANKHQQAVKAYYKVIPIGSGALANRARYLAATILQDRLGQHGRAVALLQVYLSHGKGLRPLTADAFVRQARSSLHLGRRKVAAHRLNRVLREHAGTTAAVVARRLLAKMKKKDQRSPGSRRPVTYPK